MTLDAPDGTFIVNAAGFPQTARGTQTSVTNPTETLDASGLPTGSVLRKVIGDPNPDYTASLVNEVSYKKWNFRAQLDAVQGVDVFNADFRTRQGVGNGKVAEQEQQAETHQQQVDQAKAPIGAVVILADSHATVPLAVTVATQREVTAKVTLT
jgi:hypothetical protein